jgi:DNA end-binding protein Ku
MKQTGVAGLAQYAARGKQYLVMLRPMGGGLAMQQLRYAEEVRPFSEVGVPETEIKPEELQLALQLMQQNVKQEFHPERYQDTVKKRMQEIIQQKVEGQEIHFAPGEAPKAQIIDLMEALKASLGVEDGETARPARTGAAVRKPAKASPRGKTAAENGSRKRASR